MTDNLYNLLCQTWKKNLIQSRWIISLSLNVSGNSIQFLLFFLGLVAFIFVMLKLTGEGSEQLGDLYLFSIIAFLGNFIYLFLFARQSIFFIQTISISPDQSIKMDTYYLNKFKEIKIPLQSISVDLKRFYNKTRGDFICIQFYIDSKLLGKLYSCQTWREEKIIEVFKTIKKLKGENLTYTEEQTIEKKRYDTAWLGG